MTLLRDQKRETVDEAVQPEHLVRYEDDAYSWALQQADLLGRGQAEGLDWVNLADEIADVANREYDRLGSVLERLLHQLLVWDHQPAARGQSRAITISRQRRRVQRQLDRFPSLADRRAKALDRAYPYGRLAALRETDLPLAALPTTNPYCWEDAMMRDVTLPEGREREQ